MDNNSYGVLPRQIEGNPAVQSTILTGSTDVRKIGTEAVDGTRTTHYRGTVTGDGLFAARGAAADKATQERRIQSLDQFMAMGIDDTLDMDLWIDDDNHTKQFRMRGDTRDPQGDAEGKPLDLIITFLDVNQPVTVKAPPSEDTVDIATLPDEAQAG